MPKLLQVRGRIPPHTPPDPQYDRAESITLHYPCTDKDNTILTGQFPTRLFYHRSPNDGRGTGCCQREELGRVRSPNRVPLRPNHPSDPPAIPCPLIHPTHSTLSKMRDHKLTKMYTVVSTTRSTVLGDQVPGRKQASRGTD